MRCHDPEWPLHSAAQREHTERPETCAKGTAMGVWLALLGVVIVGTLVAWWLSGPRFAKKPHEALPPSHPSQPMLYKFGNGGGGLG